MSLDLKVIQASEIEEILSFENRKLTESIQNPTERALESWNSRWRKEALEHYLSLGWSFLARDGDQLAGYFLAQPLLFFDNQTQSLWVEHIQFTSLQVRDALCELAYKLSREKHFQRVYFPQGSSIANAIKPLSPSDWNPGVALVKTTKA
jgi:hypothetical protein